MSAKLIRQYLREHEDGARVGQIAMAINRDKDDVRKALSTMPDAEIDRWEPSRGPGKFSPVWRVLIPKHCPRPE